MSDILKNIAWAFNGKAYADRMAFNAQVTNYNEQIMKARNAWNPIEIVVNAPTVNVSYEYWDGDDEIDEVMTLSADNSTNFTALELLYKINEILRDKELGDHVFFEGLTFNKSDGPVPHYFLYCGS